MLKRVPITQILTAAFLCFAAATSSAQPEPNSPLFTDSPAPTRGWQPLVRALDAITPSVDTSLKLTPKEITDRITTMLNDGNSQAALDVIEKRIAQREAAAEVSLDVQLLFLQARAYSQLGQHEKASELYRQLTIFFPELPEPWNNLGAEYMRQNKLDQAQEALDMALLAKPDYALALENLGQLQLLKADYYFQQANKPTP